ncbi:hypothetical protein [Salinispira pacifica]
MSSLRRLQTAVVLLLFTALIAFADQPAWYRSDALGLQLGPLQTAGPTAEGYSLRVERSGAREVRELFNGSEAIERTVRTYTAAGLLESETVYRKGVISRQTTFTADGRPREITSYVDGAPVEQTDYTYDSRGRPSKAVTYRFSAAEGGEPVRGPEPAWTDSYRYYPGGASGEGRGALSTHSGPPVTGATSAGSLSEVRRVYADGTRQISRFDYSGTRLAEQWVGTETDGVLTRYNARGLRTERETVRDGKTVTHEAFVYGPPAVAPTTEAGGTGSSGGNAAVGGNTATGNNGTAGGPALLSSTVEDLADGAVTQRTYRDGRIVKSVVSRGGATVSTTSFRYQGDRVEQKVVQQQDQTERWDYVYAQDSDKLVRESYYLNGTLLEVIHYGGDGNSVRERYRNGAVVLRTYYHGEQRVKEELIRDGRVIRTLEF